MNLDRANLPLHLLQHDHRLVFKYPDDRQLSDGEMTAILEIYSSEYARRLAGNQVCDGVWAAFYQDAIEVRCQHGVDIMPSLRLIHDAWSRMRHAPVIATSQGFPYAKN
jgi:hypothetical protein